MTSPAELPPLKRLAWINRQRARLDAMRREALFEARLEGQLERAIEVSGLSRKRVLEATRQENERRGRQVRWTVSR